MPESVQYWNLTADEVHLGECVLNVWSAMHRTSSATRPPAELMSLASQNDLSASHVQTAWRTLLMLHAEIVRKIEATEGQDQSIFHFWNAAGNVCQAMLKVLPDV